MSKTVHIFDLPVITGLISKLLPNVNAISFDSLKDIPDPSEVEILVGSPLEAGPLIKALPNLKWYQSTYAGVDALANFCREENFLPKAVVTRFGGVLPRKMAEWTIAQMVATERNFAAQIQNQLNGTWNQDDFLEYRSLFELTIGIIGVGEIGRKIAERCKHHEMTVLGVGRRNLCPSDVPSCLDMYRSFHELPEVLEKCDYVCSVLPDTPQTTGFFDGVVLKSCRTKKSVFINIGRGSAVTTETILRALEAGWIRRAILDVFQEEPLASDSPLWTHPQVTISPHISGTYLPEEVAQVFADNFYRFTEGRPMQHIVDLRIGY